MDRCLSLQHYKGRMEDKIAIWVALLSLALAIGNLIFVALTALTYRDKIDRSFKGIVRPRSKKRPEPGRVYRMTDKALFDREIEKKKKEKEHGDG